MKIKTEINEGAEEEIIIRCKHRSDKITLLEKLIESTLNESSELTLYINNTEHYVKKSDVLFFESESKGVYAHTAEAMLRTTHKLFELESILPPYFVRVSKSVIVNVSSISSLRRELMGGGELCFKNSDKKTYFSRNYYRILKDKIKEIRF